MARLSVTDTNLETSFRAFMLQILPPGTPVILGQVNRVPEPKAADYLVFTPLRRVPLSYNIDGQQDCRFVASIAAGVMTVTSIDEDLGLIQVGANVFGVGVAANTRITGQLSGSAGGTGTYGVTPTQIVSSVTMAAGEIAMTQPVQISYQLDFHGPRSEDFAQIASAALNDGWAVDQFRAQTPDYGLTPLYADSPRQASWANDQQQVEQRWVVEAMLQANPVVSVPQQYADVVSVEVVSVDAAYPP